MVRFRARVVAEGSKAKTSRSLRITIPKPLALTLRTEGCTFPGWVHLGVDGGEPIPAFVRFPPSRPCTDVVLPHWRYPGLRTGDEVDARVEAATPFQAAPAAGDGFDWMLYMTWDDYFATDEGDDLVLWNRYEEPFRLRRRPPEAVTYWLLGLYQAEGSKSHGAAGGGRGLGAADFSLANTNQKLLAAAVDSLESWGLSRERLSLEIVRPAGYPVDAARARFEPLGVEIVAERERAPDKHTGKQPAGVLHVKKSMPLLRMTRAVLAQIFAEGFPSKETAQAFAFAWLDGDGCITGRLEGSPRLTLAGLEDEHHVVLAGLRTAFDWQINKGRGYVNDKEGTHFTLRLNEMAELLEAGVFPYSMNRVRLLLAFDEGSAGLRSMVTQNEPFDVVGGNPLARWGLIESVGRNLGCLTKRGRAICEAHARLASEIERVSKVSPALGITHVKGVPYPDLDPDDDIDPDIDT